MPCQNGGLCIDEVHSFRCQCTSGFNGSACENDIDECAGNPCQNGATCEDRVGSFCCQCQQNDDGPLCESGNSLILQEFNSMKTVLLHCSVADPGFLKRRVSTRGWGGVGWSVPIYYLANFCRKFHENESTWTEGVPLRPAAYCWFLCRRSTAKIKLMINSTISYSITDKEISSRL